MAFDIVSPHQLGKESGFKLLDGDAVIYLRIGIKNAPNEFANEWDICVGDNTFPGITLRGNNRKGEIRDISILPPMGNKWAIVGGRRTIRITLRIGEINPVRPNWKT